MWHDNAPSAYLVLALGNWLGGVTKGVTGFGSAILNLCCWIAFVVAGVDSGTLQQAVVTEALSSTLIAPGLLYVTRAHATADFRTTAAISLFVGLSSPVGAAALARWDAQLIELVMAAALLVIMLAEQLSSLARCWSTNAASAHGAAVHATGGLTQVLDAEGQQQQQHLKSTQVDVAAAVSVNVRTAADDSSRSSSSSDSNSSSSDVCRSSRRSTAPICQQVDTRDCTICVVDAASEPAGVMADLKKGTLSHEGEGYGRQALLGMSPTTAAAAAGQPHDDGSLRQPLLPGDANGDAAGAEGCEGGLLSGDGSVTPQPLPRLQAVGNGRRFKGGAHEWLAVLGIGAVAGTASGIMEGLTGMNGPPIMICYRLLNTPKSTVRGNNAILNLLQMRLVPYYFMGLIRSVDLQLYVVACAAGVLGAVAGDLLSHNMQQKTFQALLGVLMVLCCFLMFASGLGYV